MSPPPHPPSAPPIRSPFHRLLLRPPPRPPVPPIRRPRQGAVLPAYVAYSDTAALRSPNPYDNKSGNGASADCAFHLLDEIGPPPAPHACFITGTAALSYASRPGALLAVLDATAADGVSPDLACTMLVGLYFSSDCLTLPMRLCIGWWRMVLPRTARHGQLLDDDIWAAQCWAGG
ncbi:hypothetical protein OsJ_20257 [Oryza sativa Japonica Group]|uniref:Uncharacterized protein n=1 Tax=Oryza sativa subsp. japonica TaxID=39947 RepID=A3B8R4_ORYSJ|nr:hypothetical protein OsJ_20257 [Oryza sativa Japonica Group]